MLFGVLFFQLILADVGVNPMEFGCFNEPPSCAWDAQNLTCPCFRLGQFVVGKLGDHVCPQGSRKITSNVPCKMAAALTKIPWVDGALQDSSVCQWCGNCDPAQFRISPSLRAAVGKLVCSDMYSRNWNRRITCKNIFQHDQIDNSEDHECNGVRGPAAVHEKCRIPFCQERGHFSCQQDATVHDRKALSPLAAPEDAEHEAWRSLMSPWNNSFVGPPHFPTEMRTEAACLLGPVQIVSPRANPSYTSKRYQQMNEKGYGICPQPSLRRPGCVIYSCGVDEDPSFDIFMARSTRCEVFSFDAEAGSRRWMGYLTAAADPPLPINLHFIPWAWGSYDVKIRLNPWHVALTGKCANCFFPWDRENWGSPVDTWQTLRLSTIAKRLNHSKVDLVKLDCEGVEYNEGLIQDLLKLRPEQIVLEQHQSSQTVEEKAVEVAPDQPTEIAKTLEGPLVTSATYLGFHEKLHKAGYRQIWKGRILDALGEYTLARRELTSLAKKI